MFKQLQKFLLTAALLLVPWAARAQSLTDYALTTDTTTFTSIVSTGTGITLSSSDDGSGTCVLPFDFPFGESTLNAGDNIGVSSNGFICLTGDVSGTTGSYSSPSRRVINAILASDGHMGRLSGAGVYWQVDTVDGVACLTIEYHALSTFSSPYGIYSHQVKLYENGDIQFVYDSINPNGHTSVVFRTYLWDGLQSDLAMVSGPWDAPSLGNAAATRPTTPLPAEGLRYTFTRPVVSCPKPSELAFSGVSPTGVTVSFRERGTATSWVLEYADTMFVPGTGFGTLVPLADTSYQIIDLTPQTKYYFYLHADCGGDTSLNRFATFQTPCLAYPHDSLPFFQGFEDWVAGSTGSPDTWQLGDPCWTFRTNYVNTYHYPYVSDGTAHTGSKSMYMYKQGSSYYAYFCLPLFEDSVNTLELSCWLRNNSSSSAAYGVQVGVMTSVDDISSFVPIETIYPTVTNQWQKKDVDFSGYTGPGGFITLMLPNSISSGSCYIDDIVVREHFACDGPVNPRVANLARADSVVIEWDTVSGVSDYELCYGVRGFRPSEVSSDSLVTGIYEGSYVLTLDYNTHYDVYVRSNCGSEYSNWEGPVALLTPCEVYPIDSLPYYYGFEDVVAGTSGVFTNCWRKNAVGVSGYYPYVSTSYAAEGTKSLYFYGTNSSNYSYAIMPAFDMPISSLLVSFKLYKTSMSYGSIEVGVMSNPADISTFTTIQTVQPSESNIWEEFFVPMRSYTGDGGYIAFRQASTYYTYLDDIKVEELSDCPPVTGITVSETSTSSAFVTWQYRSGYIDVPTLYEVTCVDAAGARVSNTTSDQYFMATGLTPNSRYRIVVRPMCGVAAGGADSVEFSTSSMVCMGADTTVQVSDTIVGTNYATSEYLPSFSFYNYGISQQIYRASELQGGGIRSISVMPTEVEQQRHYKVLLGHTNASTVTNYIIPADLVEVYDGTPTLVADQWCEMVFDTLFEYNGTDNLLVTFIDNTGNYVSGNTFAGHTVPGYSSRYDYRDGSPYVLSTNTGGNATSFRNNMIFAGYGCIGMATCSRPLVRVLSVTSDQVDIVWAPGADETAWSVDYKAAGDIGWTTVLSDTSITNYSFAGLAANVSYQFRVYSVCSTGDTFATVVSAQTFCAGRTVPFAETFATWATGSDAPTPSCWYKGSNYSSGYPYVTTGNSSGNDGKSMYLYSSAGSYSYLALPVMDAPMDTLSVTFKLMKTNTSYSHEIQVGVMTDPEDISTFQAVGTARPSAMVQVWSDNEFNFRGMPEGHIAFVSPSSAYCYPYLDDIRVNYYNPCVRPYNFRTVSVTTNTATIAWEDSTATSFEYEYGPVGFARGSGVSGTVSEDSLMITGLRSSLPYQIYVRGICGAGDTSEWSFAHQFNTECGKIDAFPYQENFNYWGINAVPHCWNRDGSYSTYPYTSASYKVGNTGASMYFYVYNPSVNSTRLTLPEIDTTVQPVRNLQLVFKVLQSTASYVNNLEIGVMTDPDDMTTFRPVDTISLSGRPTLEWFEYEVPLDGYNGVGDTGAFITFRSNTTSSYSYVYLDDLSVEVLPNCKRPDSLALVSVGVNDFTCRWHDRSGATEWVVEWGPLGFEPGTGTAVTVTSNPATVNGVPSSFVGDFYVYAICGDGDTSDVSRTCVPFNTRQLPATIPYHYGFEDTAEWAGWQTNSNSHIGWYRGTAASDSGSYAMYVSADSGATCSNDGFSSVVNAAAYRDIDFGTVDSSFTITFRAKAGGTISGTYDGLMVFLVDPAQDVTASTSGITSPWGNVNDLYRIATMRCDTNWNTYVGTFDTISGIHRVAFFWFNQNTSTGNPYVGGPAAVDNIHIDYASCPRPVNLDTVSVGSTTATLEWDGPTGAAYRVAYRVSGASPSTNQFVTCNTNQVVLTGLNPITPYVAWVQKICGSDSSFFSDGVRFGTDLCDDVVAASVGSEASTGSSYMAPVNNYYNYTLTQTIIDSAEIGGPMDIQYLSYYYTYATASTAKTNCTVYLQPTTLSSFGSSTDIVALDTATAVRVYTGPLNCSQGWNYIPFDTEYSYDGTGNLLVIVDDNSGAYNGSLYTFKTEPCTGNKVIYYYSDSNDPDVTNPSSFSGSKVVAGWRPVMQLLSCDAVSSCAAPVVTSETHDYHSATVTWSGSGSAYEVNIKETAAVDWPAADIAVTGNSHTFSGLSPETSYTFRVRQDCSADGNGYSVWTEGAFTTDSLPCFPPSDLAAGDVTNSHATFSWQAVGNESQWDLHVWYSGGLDSVYRVSSNPATVGGFTAGVTYSAAIRAVCGEEGFEGDYGTPITFTTQTCPDVTGLSTGNVTSSSVTVSWTADPMAESWLIEYGYSGFAQGAGTSATSATNSFTATGLDDETSYDFYVKAVCGSDWNSEGWTRVSATTAAYGGSTYTVTVNVNDPTMGSVTGAGTYNEGATCTLTATPAAGYRFVDWGNGTSDNPYSFVVTSDVTLTATFAATQGIEDVESGVSCAIYPNPATDAATISVRGANGKVRIAVVDMNGREVAGEVLECSADCEKSLDVDGLAQGAYFVRITGDAVNMVKKLIVR